MNSFAMRSLAPRNAILTGPATAPNSTKTIWRIDPMAMAGISANRFELLQIADAVAREKTIDKKIVIEAMEDAIQKAAKSRYGARMTSAARSIRRRAKRS